MIDSGVRILRPFVAPQKMKIAIDNVSMVDRERGSLSRSIFK